jgi:hypothetical protein
MSDNLTPWQRFKANQGETRPWDLLQADNKTTDEIADQRYDICKACPELIKITKQCKKCGCFMNLKVKLAAAACPIGKWESTEIKEQ